MVAAVDRLRGLAVPILVAVCAGLALAWTGLTGFTWSDYEYANLAPMQALMGGDWGTFWQDSPIEGPSLLLRSPFALLAHLWGGGDLAVYRLLAVPGLLAGAGLGVVLYAARRRAFPAERWPMLFVLLAAGNPITLRALEIGHPEELLGGALCVGAVLAALARRPWLAAVLLGLAIANKAWAVLAIGPVLLALDRRRLPVLAVAGGIAVAFVVPFLLLGGDDTRATLMTGTRSTGGVFQPWQFWWFLGEHGHVIRGYDGLPKVDWRAAPAWIGPITHPLIVALAVPATLAFRRLRGTRSPDLLLLLAVLLLARCVFDVADNGYYHLPALLALLAWEGARFRRPPLLTLAGSVLVWVSVETLPQHVSPDLQSLFYVAWAVPALVALTVVALRGPRPEPAQAAGLRVAPLPAQRPLLTLRSD